jgi:hypothetical protein
MLVYLLLELAVLLSKVSLLLLVDIPYLSVPTVVMLLPSFIRITIRYMHWRSSSEL